MATSSEQPDASEARTALAELDAALAAVGARPLRDVVQQLERASPTAAASPVQFGEPSTPSPLPSSSALPSHAGAASSAAVRTPLMPAASAFAPALVPAAGGALPGRSSISVLNEWTQKHRIAQPVYITTSKQLACVLHPSARVLSSILIAAGLDPTGARRSSSVQDAECSPSCCRQALPLCGLRDCRPALRRARGPLAQAGASGSPTSLAQLISGGVTERQRGRCAPCPAIRHQALRPLVVRRGAKLLHMSCWPSRHLLRGTNHPSVTANDA